jgi:site-specific DNA recombinase
MTIARKYRRVSTDEQANTGFSLDAQAAKLADFCDRRGYTPAGDYCDDGYSAKTLQRPAIQRLLREATAGDIIVVYKLDRLTRSAKDLEYLLELSEKREIYVQSATEDIETATPAGRLFVRMLVQFAQFERETIAERSSMGRKQQARSGRFSGSVAPFGYRLVDSGEVKRGRVMKRLERDPLTSHVVPMIFERYLGGYGARSIAVWLNDELNVRTVEDKRFSAVAVSFILRNPSYVGESVVRKRKKAVVERYEATHEPLIDKETFDAVQRLFDVRAKLPPRVATGMFPLAGIAYCGVCGGKLAGSNERMVIGGKRSDKRYRVYRCGNLVAGRGCGHPPFSSVS